MDITRSGDLQISRLEIAEKGRCRHFIYETALAILVETRFENELLVDWKRDLAGDNARRANPDQT